MLNQMIKAKKRAMIKGEMRMMGIKEKHHHIQKCVKMFKEITPLTTYLVILSNFKCNEVWSLIERPEQNVICTKWVFHNKQDELGVVTRNKARLIAKGYSQVKGLEFDETFSPVARLESIHMLLACAIHHGFKLYQIDVKNAFLKGPIKEEVYVEQLSSFESEGYPNHVYKLHKTLYELKQTLRVWYEWLSDFFIENSFRIGKSDSTPFTRKMGKDLFVYQSILESRTSWNN
jgi:hypothetical protein